MHSSQVEAAEERPGGQEVEPKEAKAELCGSKGIREVVEVGGFQVIRKRKRTDAPPSHFTPAVQAANSQPAPAPADSAGAATSGSQQHGAAAGGAKSTTDAAEQLPPAMAHPAESLPPPTQQQPQSSRSHQGAEPAAPMDVQEVQVMAEQEPQQQQPQPQEEQEKAVQQEEQRPSPPPPPQPPQPPREKDMKAVVRGLLDYIPEGCPTAVSVPWLLREAFRATVRPGDSAGAAAAASVLQSFQQGLDQRVAAAQALLQGGPEQLRQFEGLPPMVRSMCATDQRMAGLRQQLAELEAEEAAWLALEEKYQPGAAACLGDAARGAAVEQPAAEEEEQQQQVDVGALEEAQRRAEHQLSLQVDAISSMLDKAELVVAKAQQQCATLQAEYHKENLQSYGQVNSPKALVKVLSQAPAVTSQVQAIAGVEFVPPSPPTQG